MRFRILKPRTDVATAEQVRAAREARGWTVEEMADAVGATPMEVSAWEAGAVAAPPPQAARVQWMLAVDRWNAAAAEIRGGPCDWVRERVPHLYDKMLADLNGNGWYWPSPEIQRHFAACRTCRASWRAAKRLGPLPVEPDAAKFDTLRARYDRWVQRLPRFARWPFSLLGEYWIALVVSAGAITMPDPGLAARITGVGMGTLAWIAGFRIARDLLGERLRPYPFGAGFLAGAAASLPAMWLWNYFDPAVQLGDPRAWAGAAVLSVAAGVWSSRRVEPAEASDAQPAPLLGSSAAPHLLPGTRVPGIDEVPHPAEPVPDRLRSR